MKTAIARNIFSNWLGMLVTGTLSFALTPILVHRLGDFYFGMWILAMSILDYCGLLDLGIRTTLHRFVGRLKGTNERAALNETIATALAISSAIGLLVVGLTALLIFLVPRFFFVHGAARTVFQWLVLLLGLSVALLFPARVLGAYLCGLQRFDLYNLVVVATALVRAALIVVVLKLGYGVLSVAGVTLAIALFTLVCNWGLARYVDPEALLDLRKTTWSRIRELTSFSFYAFLYTLGDYLRFYADSAVIARILSMALVTPFNVAGRLMSYFKEVVLGFAGPLMPRMSELEGQARETELRQLFLRGTKIATLLSLFIGSLLIVDGRALLHLWLGERFVATYPLVLILTAGYIVALGQWPSRDLLYAKGQHRALGLWTVAEGVANILLSIYWAPRYGLFGIALGTTIPMLVMGLVVQPWYVLRLVGVSPRQYIREAVARPVLASGLFFAFCQLTTRAQGQPRLTSFLLSVVWQSFLFAVLAYAVGLAQSERQIVLRRSRHLSWLAVRLSRTALH